MDENQILTKVSNKTEIYFGDYDPEILKSRINKREFLIVTSPSHIKNGNLSRILSNLNTEPKAIIDNVPTNPSLDYLKIEVEKYKNLKVELVIALGGGSCIDSAKVLARCMKYNGDKTLETMLTEKESSVSYDSIPLIAIPTTAGTGSEVTPFATVWDKEKANKLSLSGMDIFPESALVFPTLCATAPKQVLLSSALDAISHAMDSIWNRNATEISKSNAHQALKLLSHSLIKVNLDYPAAEDMYNLSLGSLYAGLAISVSRTSLSHSISYPLTYTHGLPHGIACSFTLPAITEYVKLNDLMENDLTAHNENQGLFDTPFLYFKEVFQKHGVTEIFKQHIHAKSDVFALIPKMHNPERVLNFPKLIDFEDLTDILNKSLGLIYDT